jgi:hypothetical protein
MTIERTPKQPAEPKIPGRPRSLSYHYENNGDSLMLRQKKQLAVIFSVGCFLAFWLTGWTAGCVMLIWVVMKEPAFFTFCFAVSFWTAWFFVFGVLMAIFFGQNTVKLDRDGLFSVYRVVVRINSRQVPLGEIRYFHATQDENDESVSWSVEAVTYGKPVQFSVTDNKEAEWLAYELNQLLAMLKNANQLKIPSDVAEIAKVREDVDNEEFDEPVNIRLNSKPQTIEPPGDCHWKLNAGFDSVTFAKRGEFSLAAVGGATFPMLFWNGIVSVFVMDLWGLAPGGPEFLNGEWWFMFVFLIPFEVVGVVLFLAWFFCLIAPFQQTRWNFHRDMVTCRVQWFGIGRSWCYSMENCGTMVVDVQEPGGNMQTKVRRKLNRETGAYQLRFVDDQNEEVFSINDLTLGEAHWIANVVLEFR